MLHPSFIGQVYSSNDFTYDASTKVFVGEISAVPTVLREMYNDALDIGFAMRSAKTGRIAYFCIETAERDREGDMYRWTFKPTSDSIRRNPNLEGVVVAVYND